MKRCTKCQVEKAHKDFNKQKASPDGLQRYCRDCQKESRKVWYVDNQDHARTYAVKYHHTNRDAQLAQQAIYRQTEEYKASKRIRERARQNGLTNTMPKNAWFILLDFYGERCMFPGCDRDEPLQLDHVVPLSWGGTHTLDNAQILCAYHNTSKKNHSAADYRNGRICSEEGRVSAVI